MTSTNAPARTGRKALIVGLGISGISSAIALEQAGWEPTKERCEWPRPASR